MVRRQRRQLLLPAFPPHDARSILATRHDSIRTAGAGDPIRAAGTGLRQLSGRVDHPGLIADGVRPPAAPPGNRRRGLAAEAPGADVAGRRRSDSGRCSADVRHRVHREPVSDRHAAPADRGGGDRRLGRVRTGPSAGGRRRDVGVGGVGSVGQRVARRVEPGVEIAGFHRGAVRHR